MFLECLFSSLLLTVLTSFHNPHLVSLSSSSSTLPSNSEATVCDLLLAARNFVFRGIGLENMQGEQLYLFVHLHRQISLIFLCFTDLLTQPLPSKMVFFVPK